MKVSALKIKYNYNKKCKQCDVMWLIELILYQDILFKNMMNEEIDGSCLQCMNGEYLHKLGIPTTMHLE